MKTVGFTAGVFDMFHVGHLNLIQNARALCDYLVVGVNSDELVGTYKDKKAVVPFAERIKIVAAIRFVDEVMRVSTLDKEAVWRSRPYNLLFIGDDWKGSPRWSETERVMLTHGVKTVYLPYTTGTTSSILRNKIASEV